MRTSAFFLVWLACGGALAAGRLPLRDGEYSSKPCNGVPELENSFGFYDGSITPVAEGLDINYFCKISKLAVAGSAYTGSAVCDVDLRVRWPTRRYNFSFTIADNSTFVSKGKTYRWCAPHR